MTDRQLLVYGARVRLAWFRKAEELGSVSAACYYSGVSRSTYYEYLATNKDFSDKMRMAEEWSTFRARQVILQAIDSGDIKAAQWWLERKSKAEFAQKS
jgi:hypothetical protein